MKRKILFIVPLYKNAKLIPALVDSLATSDFEAFDSRVLFINDSPEDSELASALAAHLPRLPEFCYAQILVNDRNLGFINSSNRGLRLALAQGRDAILFNSDALLTPGALREMADVMESDPLIGFVNPRSNNATICNSPYPETYRDLPADAALRAHRRLEQFLPRVTYVPTAVGFCLYIRHLMLAEFGLLDEAYGDGYNEENDFILRCNRRGYRAVLANRAFVYHIGNASFSLTQISPDARESKNRKLLLKRYPEYERAVRRYFDGSEFRAQWLLAGLIPNKQERLRILFECSNFSCAYNGTVEFGKKAIAAFCARFADLYECYISCTSDALKFHGLDHVENLSYIGELTDAERTAPFAAVVRLSQPFTTKELTSLARLSPVTAFVMLDTIAMDCQNLDKVDLRLLWSRMLQVSNLIGYNSEFSREQFRRRFDVPGEIVEFQAFHSVDLKDYLPTSKSPLRPLEHKDYVLIVGNHFIHKSVADTVAAFHGVATPSIVVLGVPIEDDLVMASYLAGELEEEFVESLYANAASVLFPSHYEGFGFPILHALKYRKPVVARDLPSTREIKAQASFSANIHLFSTTREMVEFSSTGPEWLVESLTEPSLHNWAACASALEEGVRKAVNKLQFSSIRNRVEFTDLLNEELLLDEMQGRGKKRRKWWRLFGH